MKVNTEAIPGTLHLVDEQGVFLGKHDKGNQDIVLNPTPSDDPNDPLNWTPRRKYMSMFCVVVYCFGIGVPSAAIYSVLTPVSEKTGLSLSTLNQGTGYMFLFFGLGCFVFQPLALQYGKRPIYLFSMLSTSLILLWAPHTTSIGQWIGGKILQGFLGAPIESLLEVSISDVWFEHERGRWMSMYAFSLLTSNYIAPLVAGFISDGQGWEWVLYWCSIFGAACFFFLFFFMEESNFSRKTISEDDVIHESSGSDSKEGVSTEVAEVAYESDTAESTSNMQVKTFMQKLKLFDVKRPSDQLWINFIRPITMLRYPSIIWAGFCYGSSLVWFNVLNGTASLIFTSYYGFSAAQVGLVYISPIVGTIILSLFSGWFADYVKVKLAQRAGGVSEAEHRLWAIVPFLIVGPAGLILWGVGSSHGLPWIGPAIGMGMIGGAGTLGCSVPCNYAIDSYRELSGHGMVGVIFIRNMMSFAIGYGITPWINGMGIQNTFITACFIAIACICTFLIMVVWGKKWRDQHKASYWRYVQEALDKGMAH